MVWLPPPAVPEARAGEREYTPCVLRLPRRTATEPGSSCEVGAGGAVAALHRRRTGGSGLGDWRGVPHMALPAPPPRTSSSSGDACGGENWGAVGLTRLSQPRPSPSPSPSPIGDPCCPGQPHLAPRASPSTHTHRCRPRPCLGAVEAMRGVLGDVNGQDQGCENG